MAGPRRNPPWEPIFHPAPPRIVLPAYARVVRGFGLGAHPYLDLLPRVLESPAMVRIVRGRLDAAAGLVSGAAVRVVDWKGYIHIDSKAAEIVLAARYYERGSDLDLYLDLLHELTHLRQLSEGADLWDERMTYPNRSTEIEGYAVAVEEARRLGLTRSEVLEHLRSPWLTDADVRELYANVARYLDLPPEEPEGPPAT